MRCVQRQIDFRHYYSDILGSPGWLQAVTNTGTLNADLSAFYCFLQNKLAVKGLLLDTQYLFTLLTVICNSTIHTQRIVVFLLQQCLGDSATVIRYMCIACLIFK